MISVSAFLHYAVHHNPQRTWEASANTYLIGSFSGPQNCTGQIVTNYGQYVNSLTYLDGTGWRISNRTLVNTVGCSRISNVKGLVPIDSSLSDNYWECEHPEKSSLTAIPSTYYISWERQN